MPRPSTRLETRAPRWCVALALAVGLALTGCSRRTDQGINEAAVRTALSRGPDTRDPSRSWKHLDPAVGRHLTGAASWDDRLNGPVTTFFESGVRESEGTYKNGDRVGLWQFWHENGRLRWQGNYVASKIDGKVLTWHENGELETIGQFDGGDRHGRLQTFWPDGTPRSEGIYRADRRDGAFFYWQYDGSPDPSRSGFYERDKRLRALNSQLLSSAKPPERE